MLHRAIIKKLLGRQYFECYNCPVQRSLAVYPNHAMIVQHMHVACKNMDERSLFGVIVSKANSWCPHAYEQPDYTQLLRIENQLVANWHSVYISTGIHTNTSTPDTHK